MLTIDRTGRQTLPPHIAIQFMKQEMKGAFNDLLLDKLEALLGKGDYLQLLL
jgi:hypothetical protein